MKPAATLVDIAAGHVIQSFPVGADPEGVTITPENKLVLSTLPPAVAVLK
jgi:DNA-binding beta-propeller fold protein YncE